MLCMYVSKYGVHDNQIMQLISRGMNLLEEC